MHENICALVARTPAPASPILPAALFLLTHALITGDARAEIIDKCKIENDAADGHGAIALYDAYAGLPQAESTTQISPDDIRDSIRDNAIHNNPALTPARARICVTEGTASALLDIWDGEGAYIGVIRLHGPKAAKLDVNTCWRGAVTKVNFLHVRDEAEKDDVCVRAIFLPHERDIPDGAMIDTSIADTSGEEPKRRPPPKTLP